MLDLIAEGDIILAGGHLPASELHLVFAEAKKRGVKKMLVNHPTYIVGCTDEDIRQMVALGVYMEHSICMFVEGKAHKYGPDKLAHLIEVAGVDHTVLCSDLGLQGSPRPIEGYRAIVRQLLDLQFSRGRHPHHDQPQRGGAVEHGGVTLKRRARIPSARARSGAQAATRIAPPLRDRDGGQRAQYASRLRPAGFGEPSIAALHFRHILPPIVRPQRHVGKSLALVGGAADQVRGAQILPRQIVGELAQRILQQLEPAQHHRRRHRDRRSAGQHHARDVEPALRAVDADQRLVRSERGARRSRASGR